MARKDAADGVVGYDENFVFDEENEKMKNIGKIYDLDFLDESK